MLTHRPALERRHIVNEFARNVERPRRELLLHRYRMLGSLPDAEDAVQETLLLATKSVAHSLSVAHSFHNGEHEGQQSVGFRHE